MLTVRQLEFGHGINCGGKNGVTRTLLPHVTRMFSMFGTSYITAFTITIMSAASVELYKLTLQEKRELFDRLSAEQKRVFGETISTLYRDAEVDDHDNSYAACVNREVRRTLDLLHRQLVGEKISDRELVAA